MDKPRILHVEDEDFLREYIHRILDDDFIVINAGRLDEAVDILRNDRIDLVLLDLVLPDGSGLDLVERIRDCDRHVPVVVFSAHEVTDAIIGVNGVIVKGTPPAQIYESISGCLNRIRDDQQSVS